MRSTITQLAQCYLILAHISHSSFQAWNASLVVQLNAQQSNHWLSAEFS